MCPCHRAFDASVVAAPCCTLAPDITRGEGVVRGRWRWTVSSADTIPVFADDRHHVMNQAQALHATLLSALGLDATLPADDSSIPLGKVAATTSDTTNVMPATAKELALYPLCHDTFWVPCAVHELGLFLKDEMKIHNVQAFLGKAGRIASIFLSCKQADLHVRFSSCAHLFLLRLVPCVLYMPCVFCNL
jgi:hypothetical protein